MIERSKVSHSSLRKGDAILARHDWSRYPQLAPNAQRSDVLATELRAPFIPVGVLPRVPTYPTASEDSIRVHYLIVSDGSQRSPGTTLSDL